MMSVFFHEEEVQGQIELFHFAKFVMLFIGLILLCLLTQLCLVTLHRCNQMGITLIWKK